MGEKLILSDLVLPSRVNRKCQYSGIDSINNCLDRQHFETYPYPIDYSYNSRGFRDQEWPEDIKALREATWCIGDSFTVGLGQPLAHIWPQVLESASGHRCINISMDGASNDWIYRRALYIMREVRPTHMVVMWSYTHRRESPRLDLDDDQRVLYASKCSPEQDFAHWVDLSNKLYLQDRNVTQATIPDFHLETPKESAADLWHAIKGESWPACPQTVSDLGTLPKFVLDEIHNVYKCHDSLKNLLEQRSEIPHLLANVIHIAERLDWARDHHHFDILTSRWVVDRILRQMVA